MASEPAIAPPAGTLALLERAIAYTRTSLQLVTPDRLALPTPCEDWDLRALLHHMGDSLLALHEAVDTGYVGLEPGGMDDSAADLLATLRTRTCSLLGTWASREAMTVVSVAGRPLPAGVVAGTGAMEIAVHGWDVARACGHDRPLPQPLAEDLLALAPQLVSEADRPVRFAAAVAMPPLASSSDRLLALLGRHL